MFQDSGCPPKKRRINSSLITTDPPSKTSQKNVGQVADRLLMKRHDEKNYSTAEAQRRKGI